MDRNIFASLCTGVRFDKQKAAAGAAAAKPQAQPEAVAEELPSAAEPASNDPLEADNAVRKRHRIRVKGGDAPTPLRSFEQLQARPGCPPGLAATLAGLGCRQPTPIQQQAIPVLLARREILAVAPTGSGKTLAYLLPLLLALCAERVKGDGGKSGGNDDDRSGGDGGGPKAPIQGGPRAVVLAPTRELAAQISRVLDTLLPGTGLRGRLLSKSTAAGSDFSKVDILLGTPLLAGQQVAAKKLALDGARFLILDEGDRLLDEQFVEQVDAVLAACTAPDLVRALFSASLSEAVEDLARTLMHEPLRVTVGERGAAVASVAQRLQFVGNEAGKLLALRQAVAKGLRLPVLVFVSSKDRALELHRELLLDGLPADSITADQGAAARRTAIEKFRSGKTWLLVTTDLLARGNDFVLDTVISYDFPHSTTDYIHRVGRTGRAGRTGQAVTYFTEDDMPRVKKVANIIVAAGGEVPSYIADYKEGIQQQPKPRKKGEAKGEAKGKDRQPKAARKLKHIG